MSGGLSYKYEWQLFARKFLIGQSERLIFKYERSKPPFLQVGIRLKRSNCHEPRTPTRQRPARCYLLVARSCRSVPCRGPFNGELRSAELAGHCYILSPQLWRACRNHKIVSRRAALLLPYSSIGRACIAIIHGNGSKRSDLTRAARAQAFCEVIRIEDGQAEAPYRRYSATLDAPELDSLESGNFVSRTMHVHGQVFSAIRLCVQNPDGGCGISTEFRRFNKVIKIIQHS